MEELVRKFVGKITDDSKYAPKLIEHALTVMTSHQAGKKSAEKAALLAFAKALPPNFDAAFRKKLAKDLAQLAKKNVKPAKSGKFSFSAAFKKQRSSFAKMLRFSKKGDSKAVKNEIKSLHASMRLSGEISEKITADAFEYEVLNFSPELAEASSQARDRKRKKYKASDVKKIKFSNFMKARKIEVNRDNTELVEDLALKVLNAGSLSDRDAFMAASAIAFQMKPLKQKPADLVAKMVNYLEGQTTWRLQ